MRRKKTGFTLIEMLAALAIIALMIGLLIPATSMVKKTAREAKQRAQFTAIDLALVAFKNDYGDYPPSDWPLPPAQGSDYCGAQKLAEALIGWDLLGFHPKSEFRSDGRTSDGQFIYDTEDAELFAQRKDPYIELENANVFRLGNISVDYPGLFNDTINLAPNTFVLCDVFGAKRVTLAKSKTVKAGMPILYYKANTSRKELEDIYKAQDNDAIVAIKARADGDIRFAKNPLGLPEGPYQYFNNYIRNPKITAKPWPYRADSYILISAGPDGYYGTDDDVCNFGN